MLRVLPFGGFVLHRGDKVAELLPIGIWGGSCCLWARLALAFCLAAVFATALVLAAVALAFTMAFLFLPILGWMLRVETKIAKGSQYAMCACMQWTVYSNYLEPRTNVRVHPHGMLCMQCKEHQLPA